MIRFAEPQDLAQIRALWDVCFPDSSGFNEYFFAHIFDFHKTLLLEQQGVLCAMLQMLPYRLSVGDETCEATYIYGACTAPDARRKGYMSRLLDHSFALDRAEGRAASILIPAEPWLFDFYRSFGYKSGFYVQTQSIVRTQGGVLPRRLTVQDIPALAACYTRLTPPFHVLRSEQDWKTQLALFDAIGCGAYGWFDGEQLMAYAFCWADNAQEALGLNEQQAQGLLQVMGLTALPCIGCGTDRALGCVKWYDGRENSCGYMNLMLN